MKPFWRKKFVKGGLFLFLCSEKSFIMYDIFISYSRHDSNVVNEIVTLLEQEGYSIWIDRDGIESGEDFKRVILKAIKESKVVLFFSSEHSNVSDWTAKEIGVAVKYKKYIIPVKLDNSNYNEASEFDLINLDYIDYSKPSIKPVMHEKLLNTLRKKLGLGNSKRIDGLEAERKAGQTAATNLPDSSVDAKPKPKKGFWIGFGAAAVAVLVLVLVLVWPKGHDLSVSGSNNGHDYVDFNLPSGTLWATCNVGANKPEDYGNYYAWGEKYTKDTYNWDTYKYANDVDKLTKYCDVPFYGVDDFIDTLTILQGCDDPATTWGNGWFSPSYDQWEELLYYTTWQWTTQNGVKGMLFTHTRYGQTLFLPAAGARDDSVFNNVGSVGYYWSRSLRTGDPVGAWDLLLRPADPCMEYWYRYSGLSVRPVHQD